MKRRYKTRILTKEQQYDASGNAIINMTVEDDSGFLSAFSEGETPVISEEVANFIESRAEALRPRDGVTLHIHSNCIDDNEKQVYDHAIREYYTERYIGNARHLRRNAVVAITLAVFGILVLAFSLFLGSQGDSILWSEVIDIVAWVLLWEAVDISVFQSHILRLCRLRYLACINMKIEYVETDKKGS